MCNERYTIIERQCYHPDKRFIFPFQAMLFAPKKILFRSVVVSGVEVIIMYIVCIYRVVLVGCSTSNTGGYRYGILCYIKRLVYSANIYLVGCDVQKGTHILWPCFTLSRVIVYCFYWSLGNWTMYLFN